MISQYLSPEPLLQDPSWVAGELQAGHDAPAYAYARNDPIGHSDPTGRFTVDQSSFKAARAGSRWNYVYDLGMAIVSMSACKAHFAATFRGYDVVANFSMSGGPRLVFEPGGTSASVAHSSNGTVYIDADKFRRYPALEVVRRLVHELAHDAYDRRPRTGLCEPDMDYNDEEEQAREAEEKCLGARAEEYLP